MNAPPDAADRLDLASYEGMLWHWNEAHSTDDASLEAPDPERAVKIMALINADPRLTN